MPHNVSSYPSFSSGFVILFCRRFSLRRRLHSHDDGYDQSGAGDIRGGPDQQAAY